jgi:hypothetical protein
MVFQDRSYLTFAYRSNIHYIDVFGKLIYSNFTNHKNQPTNQLLPCTSCIPGEPSVGYRCRHWARCRCRDICNYNRLAFVSPKTNTTHTSELLSYESRIH